MSNRARIVDAAVRLFAREGYDQTTVEDLLRETGVARSNFYYHFEDKRDLSLALVERWARAWRAAIDELSEAGVDRPGRLRRLLDVARGEGPSGTAPHVTLVALETAALDPGAREEVLSVTDRLAAALEDRADGAADLLVAAVLGSAVLARAAPGAERLDRIERAAAGLARSGGG